MARPNKQGFPEWNPTNKTLSMLSNISEKVRYKDSGSVYNR